MESKVRSATADLLEVARQLSDRVSEIEFGPPVTHVYNPLDYAWQAHAEYLGRYGIRGERRTVLLGMNPGPWGMAQTGVPFGEVTLVADWLGIRVAVGRPATEHPKRPIEGLACRRSEVSGGRLWGWAKEQFGSPDAFFEKFFVANYCPLMFMEESGRNRTPDRLPMVERRCLLEACDTALRQSIRLIQPEWVVGVGRFATQRATEALSDLNVRIGQILHPSPANPAANRDWRGQAVAQLTALGITL
jgi:single-strand selective monofunctional uracil DNA glycosylase